MTIADCNAFIADAGHASLVIVAAWIALAVLWSYVLVRLFNKWDEEKVG